MTEPVGGFAHDAISTMFDPPSTASSPATSSLPPTDAPPTTSGAKHHHGSNVGAIVGAVIGGIAGLSIAACLAIWVLRRRGRLSRSQQSAQELSTDHTQAKDGYPAYPTWEEKKPPMEELPGESPFTELPTEPMFHELPAGSPSQELPVGWLSVRDMAGLERNEEVHELGPAKSVGSSAL
ncbi:hypothetical protein LTR85_001091 [Meristemomyces frigidus]|nr:hypothetical protein LTR85_001091 [Meristemomyces frigidus]